MTHVPEMGDISNPQQYVEVKLAMQTGGKSKNRMLWVNVDGQCVLRICQIHPDKLVTMVDETKAPPCDPPKLAGIWKCECGCNNQPKQVDCYSCGLPKKSGAESVATLS